ncbi:hypothetical protein E3N88_41518 [Mikania micrantha]|uniref:DUF223 domain-containing protein n=1 Tax=Mikania micrantha TaxID=192012 RepID=A0A5N6LKE6_9ASTR|nr:hypothetical protein E3N88_41518 [Mikania micrantha]
MEAIVAAPEITMLNHLDVSIDDYIIKVRILRKWRQSDRKIPNEDYSIEMILIDEEVMIKTRYMKRLLGEVSDWNMGSKSVKARRAKGWGRIFYTSHSYLFY